MTETTAADAKAYIIAHDKRVRQLDRMSVPALRATYRQSLDAAGAQLIYGGPMSKDELVNAICEIEFPDVAGAREAYVQSVVAG